MDSKVSEKDMREVYFQAFGKEYDGKHRKTPPLPLEIAYIIAINKLKKDGKYAGGGEITDDSYYQSVNHFVYFCMNYPNDFLDAFGSLKTHLSNKFKDYYNRFGVYGVMIKFYTELDGKNRRILTDYSLKNYKGTPISSDVSEVEYFNSVNHFIFFCFNFPDNFMDAFSSHLKVHLSSKWTNAYEKKGSIGAMIYFWSELDNENRKKLANWSKNNYTGTKLYEVGGALGDVAGMLPSPLPMSTIQPMAKGGKVISKAEKLANKIRQDYQNGVVVSVFNDFGDSASFTISAPFDYSLSKERAKEINKEYFNGDGSISGSGNEHYLDVNFDFDTFNNGGQLEFFADGGGVGKKSDRNETQENNFGVSYKLGDKFILGKRFGDNKDIEVSITEIMPSGLFFKVDKSDKTFSIKTLHSKGSTYTSGEYLIPIKNQYADGGKVDYYELQDLKNKESVLEKELHQIIDNQSDGWRIDLALIKSELESVREEISELENKYADGGGVKSDYYIFEGMDNLNGKPLYRVESSSDSENEYVGEWHTDKSDAEKELKSFYADGGEIKEGDKVSWRDNDYILSRIEENMVAGFRDTKYYLTSTKVGVKDANLDSLRDVKKVSFKNGGGVDVVWIALSKTKNGLLLSERFDKQITHKQLFDFYKKMGYEIIDSNIFKVTNKDELDVFKDAISKFIKEKYNELVDWENSLLSYEIVGDRIIAQSCFVQTKNGNEYKITPNDLLNKKFNDGGGVDIDLEDDFKKALVTSNFTYYTDNSDGIRMFRNSDKEELTDSAFAENSLAEDIENDDIVWASDDMKYNINAMRGEL